MNEHSSIKNLSKNYSIFRKNLYINEQIFRCQVNKTRKDERNMRMLTNPINQNQTKGVI